MWFQERPHEVYSSRFGVHMKKGVNVKNKVIHEHDLGIDVLYNEQLPFTCSARDSNDLMSATRKQYQGVADKN